MIRLKAMHHYRMDFPLFGEMEKRKLQLMQRIKSIENDLKEKGFKGKNGIKNLTCHAPYTTAAVCLMSTEGEEEWLPDQIHEIKSENLDSWKSKIWVQKIFVNPFKPTQEKLSEEKVWLDAIKKKQKVEDLYKAYVLGDEETLTRYKAQEKREQEQEKIEEKKKEAQSIQRTLTGKNLNK